jgi:hypothetical protein
LSPEVPGSFPPINQTGIIAGSDSKHHMLIGQLIFNSTNDEQGSHVLVSEPRPIAMMRQPDDKNGNCLSEGFPLEPQSG